MLNIVYFNNTHIKSYYSYPIPNTCGMCGDVISKRFDTIAEFTAFENFISFEKKGKNEVKRVENKNMIARKYRIVELENF